MNYKASIDIQSKVLTILVFGFFIVVGWNNINALLFAHNDAFQIVKRCSIVILFLVVIIGSYLYSTSKYSLTKSELIIHRPIKDRIIGIEDITEIKSIDSGDLAGTIRTFGNGGLFGYYGKYQNPKIGLMIWYVTQRKNRILIQTKQGKKVVISPDDMGLLNRILSMKVENR